MARMPRDLARAPRVALPSGVGASAEVEVADTGVLLALSGPNNELLKVLGEEAGIGVGLRGNSILLAGEPERETCWRLPLLKPTRTWRTRSARFMDGE